MIQHNGKTLEVKQKNGKYYATFTALSEDDTLLINHPDDCLGDSVLKNIQLEKNPFPSKFVIPEIKEGFISGIFKQLKEINLNFRKADGETLHQLEITANGLRESIKDSEGKLNTKILAIPGQISAAVSNAEKGLKSQIDVIPGLIKQQVTDSEKKLKTQIDLIPGKIRSAITSSEKGMKSLIEQTAETTRTVHIEKAKKESKDYAVSQIEQSAREIKTLLTKAEKNSKDFTSTEISKKAGEISAQISKAVDGNEALLLNKIKATESTLENKIISAKNTANGAVTQVNEVKRKADSTYNLIMVNDGSGKSLKTKINEAIDTATLSQRTVKNMESGMSSRFSQIENSFAFKIKSGNDIKTQLNLSDKGVKIDSALTHISGKSLIDNGVIKEAHIGNLSASKITSGTIDATRIRVINLDANNITVNKGRLIQLLLDGTYSRLRATGDSVDIIGDNGYAAIKLQNFGMQIFRRGQRAGWFQTYEGGVGVIADRGNDLALGYRNDNNSTGFESSLTINAITGDIQLSKPLTVGGKYNLRLMEYPDGIALLLGGYSATGLIITPQGLKKIINNTTYSL